MIKFIFSFDDGAVEDITLAELMREYEFDAVFYIPALWEQHNRSQGREPLNKSELLSIAKDFEIGSHTVTHPMLTRIPIDQARDEIINSKEMLQDITGQPIASFCYPRGYANHEIRDIVAENYSSARNTLVGSLDQPKDMIWQSTTVHAGGKRRPEYEGKSWLDEAFRLLDEAILRGKNEDVVYHTWAHGWELTREGAWIDFGTLLERIKDVGTSS